MNPIATQNPEEIPASLTYITLRRADFLTDCSLTDAFVKGLPDSFASMPQVTTPRHSAQAHRMLGRVFQVREWNSCWRCRAAESIAWKVRMRPYSRWSVKRREGKCKCLCDSFSSLRVRIDIGCARRDVSPSV